MPEESYPLMMAVWFGEALRMRRVLFGLVVVCFCGVGWSQSTSWPAGPEHAVVALWPQGAPGVKTATGAEGETSTAASPLMAGRWVARVGNVSVPTLTVYEPKGAGDGTGVVVFPGGAYKILAMDLEGTEVCDWLNSRGVACFLLKYRVPDTGPYPKSDEALEDAQRAVGLVREHAAEWKVDAKKIGVLGFSAGGHLAAALSTHYETRLYRRVDAADKLSCRPDFAVVVYPGYLADAENGMKFSADIPVTKDTPPTFLVQAEDDTVHVENAVEYFLALKSAGVPTELHVYAEGGHGYGLRRTKLPVTGWPELVDVWMKTIGVTPKVH
ncbi:alpha/beta hydrolase [Tunturiibacter empetritectus]|uniref:Acetyl esterase/lipase n=1 Tax=Tunturiibacter lichenicola TaxID=2051959 RepID=A0A852VER9_9BACT|nr:alpha/beta hydrolase [Edaphobacter lichenicola]NYF87936.1 acetyl esterase/lipase [Edaphobacter lichenicola]